MLRGPLTPRTGSPIEELSLRGKREAESERGEEEEEYKTEVSRGRQVEEEEE